MKTRFTSFLFASLLAFSSAVQVSPVQADVNNNTDAKVRDTVVDPEESATPAPAETPSFLPSPSPAASASEGTEASPTPAASPTPEETAAASSADTSASVDPEESPASSTTPASTSSAALTETEQPAALTETNQPAALTEMDQEASVKADDKLVHDFDAEVFYGGMRRDDGKYVWSARSHAPDHRFSYRVSFGLGDEQSGDDMVFAPGTVKITVPVTVLTDRDGNRADKYEMSIPSMEEVKESEESGTPLDNDVSFAYEEVDGQIVITNIRNVDPGFEGFIEMSYLTTEETFAYEDMKQQGAFTATITAMDPATVTDTETLNGTWTTPQTVTVAGVYIDTQVTLQQMAERAPAQYDSWQKAWGKTPENAGKYAYFVYEIESVIGDNSQEYAMSIDDQITSLIKDGNSITPADSFADTGVAAAKAVAWYNANGAYAIRQRSDQDGDGNSNGHYQKESGLRYDYVVVAVNKELLADTNKLEITTLTTETVHPRDDDADGTQASSQTYERRFVWNKPVFHGYGGGFGGWVRADGFYRYQSGRNEWPREYFTELGNHASNYSSYNLNDLVKLNNSMPISGLDYAIWTEGYVGSWSIKRNTKETEPENYFKEPVRYEMTDNQFFLSDENDGVSQDEKDRLTSSDDYQIDSLRFNVYAYDATFDKNRLEFVNSGKVTYDDNEVLTFYVQTGTTNAEFAKAADYNLKTNTFTSINEKYVKATDTTIYGGPEIDFTDDVVGYRFETKNTHYYTRIGVVPSVTLKDSPRVKGYYSPDKTESFALNNRTVTTIYDYKDKDGNVLAPGSDGEYQHAVWGPAVAQDADFIRMVEKAGSLTKDIVASTNLQKKKEYRVTWKIHADESYNYGQNEKGYTEQNGGTFYDILPIGAVLDPDSIVISTNEGELPSSSYSLKTISTNYQDSGRTLIKITVYDPANWYDLYYDTVHTYEAIRDYGNEAYNSVAYQTGNDSIEGFYVNPDSPTTGKIRSSFERYLSDEKDGRDAKKNKEMELLYEGVGVKDPADDLHFLFRGRDGDIEAITAAASGLTKRILSSRSNRYDTTAIVDNNSEYNYRLRFQNSYSSSSKNIILYDDLENYQKDNRSSDWKGTLNAIDFSALPKDKAGKALIKPVVYYSSESQNFDGKSVPDLAGWKVLTLCNDGSIPKDLQKDIRAIAIDLSKTPDGADYMLGKGEAVSVNLTMTAPSGGERKDQTSGYPETYNGVLISYDRITDSSSRHQVTMEGCTVGQLVISRDVNIKKLSAQDHTLIRGIQFRLYGTSDYGTAIDQIQSTDRNGELTFAKVEKGTYTLMEYGSNPDWLDDHTAYKVEINDAGELWITNPKKTDENGTALKQEYARTKEKTPFWFEVENTPRIHGDLSFYKARQTTATNDALIGIADTTFELSGTSDYGNDVVKTAISDKNGLVKIQNIEKGTYTLREIKANVDYILNASEYQVVVNDAGSVTLFKPDKDNSGTYVSADEIGGQPVVFNTPAYWDVSFLKVDKDLPTRTLQGAEFTITGASLDQPKTVISDPYGRVTFKHLKAGSYVLKETKAPVGLNGEGKKPEKENESDGVLNYTADPSGYLLTINDDGTFTITKNNEALSKNTDGDYLFPDERALDGQITIIKKWDDASDNDHRPSPVVHLYRTEDGQSATGVRVIVEWLNDSQFTRPSDFTVYVNGEDKTISSADPNVEVTKAGNIWIYYFKNLDATKSYTAYEGNVPQGYNGTAVGKENAINVVRGRATIQNSFSYSQSFDCTMTEQTFKAPYSGYYKLEVWGAAGGHDSQLGGNGGYSTGTVYLTKDQTLFVYVGQKGGSSTNGKGGGWNGGGDAGSAGSSGGGGGMTHISTKRNPVDNHAMRDEKNNRGENPNWDPDGTIIVAGGGGGGGNSGGTLDQLIGGYGGGETAGAGGAEKAASNETKTGYMQGYGQNRYDAQFYDGGGAGAGWYGGMVRSTYDVAGGGGTGYVADKLGQYPITHGQTVAGNQEFPTTDGTKKEKGHNGNGYAKITFVSETSDVTQPVINDSQTSSATNEDEYTTSIEFGKLGGWTQVDDNTWKYVMPVFDDTAEYTYWEKPVDGYTSDAPDSKDHAVEKKAVLNGSENKTLVVTNTSSTKYGSITVKKTVVDVSGNELKTSTQDFTFTLTLTTEENNPLTGTQIIGDSVFTDGSVTFTLHEGESKTFTNVPIGLNYKVHEDANANYNYGNALNDVSGVVSADQSKVEVTNTYTPAEKSRTDITLVKKAEGSVDGSQDDTYPFHAHLTGLDANLEFGVVIGSDDSNTTVQNYMSNAQGEADVTLNLKADQKAVFKDVPVGATYQFVEDAGKWTSRYNVSNASGGTIARTSGSNTAENQELATAIEKVDEGEQTTVTFINTLAFTQKLTVKKTVSESVQQIDPNEKFEVTVTITGLKPSAKIDTDSVGILTADDTGMAVKTFNLKNKQSVVFRNVPVSAQYQVKETKNDYIASYTITSSRRAIDAGENKTANRDLNTNIQTVLRDEDPTVELISGAHWIKVDLKKTSEDGTLLRGANFTLYKMEGNTSVEYKMNHAGDTDEKGSSAISLGEKTLTLPEGTYLLEETKAPRGYLITEDAKTITFTVNGNGVSLNGENKLASIETKDDQTPVIVIKNQAGTRLPSTGGMDVRILLLAALLMIGTSLFGFWKLRKDDSARKN
ncbi:MAG: SpaA isopeptide-forming pilin-related protein [Erysipelotrichaceae bacterium]|nr:SpaA isopeptide-forming pilin-related protein [Erysipelotrichaceae bacterium]